MQKIGVVIVAGGNGERMGADIPKQFLLLCGVPVLALTVRRFMVALPGAQIVVVLPEGQMERWRAICEEDNLLNSHIVCVGGITRFESVRNGLSMLSECDYVAIHDGVRPLVSDQLIMRCVASAEFSGAAIPVIAPVDSFRMVDGDSSCVIARAALRAVQTPQVFRWNVIMEGYRAEYDARFTDDATVVESLGIDVRLCDGERHNIKLTTPEDMEIAACFVKLFRF